MRIAKRIGDAARALAGKEDPQEVTHEAGAATPATDASLTLPEPFMGPRLGASGQRIQQGVSFLESQDAAEELQTKLGRMQSFGALSRGDASVIAQLNALKLPIKQAEWKVEEGEEPPDLPSVAAAKREAAKVDPSNTLNQGGPAERDEPAKGAPKPKPPMSFADDEPAPPPKLRLVKDGEKPEPETAGPADDPASLEAASLAKADANARALAVLNSMLFGAPYQQYEMATPWRKVRHEALRKLDYGHAFFERIWARKMGPLGEFLLVDKLLWMHPASIVEIRATRDGELVSVKQRTQARWWDEPDTPERSEFIDKEIPAEDLAWFVLDQEGSDFEGTALIRAFFACAKRRGYMARLRIVDAQRRAVPIPSVSVPATASPENKALAKQSVQRIAMGGHAQTQYLYNPDGITFDFVEGKGEPVPISDWMRDEADQIREVVGSQFTNLGQQGTGGSRAVAGELSKYFNQHLLEIADGLRAEFQRHVVEPVVLHNWADTIPMPRLRVSDVTPEDLTQVMEAKKNGLVTWTEEDEQEARRKLKWRPLSAEEKAARAEKKAAGEALARMALGAKPDDAKGDDAKPGDAPKAGANAPPMPPPVIKPPAELADTDLSDKSDEKARRKALRDSRIALVKRHLPVDDILRRREEMRREFVHAIEPLRRAAIEEALSKATITGTRADIPKLKSAPLRDAMALFAERARDFGRETARTEIRSRVAEALAMRPPSVDMADNASKPKPFDPFAPNKAKRGITGVSKVASAISEELETVIGLNVDDMLAAVVRGVRREILAELAAQASDAEAIDAARRRLLDRSDAPLEEMGDHIAARGMAGGRAEVAEQARQEMGGGEEGVVLEYATRIHVGGDEPCDECTALEGETAEVGSDRYYAIMPPARCLGGHWCHCQYSYDVQPRTKQ